MLGILEPQQVDDVLRHELIGRIGCYAEGHVYVVPITYAYDGESVYGHSADGMKLEYMRANPNVCFEVEHVDDLGHWQSVIAWGTFEELHGAAADEGMRRLVERVAPRLGSETMKAPSNAQLTDHAATAQPHGQSTMQSHGSATGRHAVLYRIHLAEKTGRFETR